ncbi:MAG: PEGA domain-containing protein, partial [Candidatus Aminicenantes bacterium]|nr:PEGA domain-containing protein [Candidatus Aminicenantes bacterium]
EESAPAIKKGKKFPWLIVALVVVAGGAAVYFLVLKKKKYTLTVTVGEGVTGTPAAGTSTNEKGTVVNYNYSLQSGYNDLSVTLDGAPVAASGTVTMNANHTLEAKATKTFVLTVSKGAHVTGTPNSGTYSYARGTNVPYSYAPESGYSGLEVKIDGAAAATSGAISMNDNHSLSAALQGANLVVNSTPAGARIYFDYVDTGHTTPYSFFFPTAQSGLNVYVRAAACGYQEYHQTVSVNVGQTVTINPTLAIGIREDFGIPAATCWSPYYTTGWSIFAATYRYTGAPSGGSPNVFVRSFSGDYTVSSEMNRIKGSTASANAIFLGTSSSKTSAYGYFFAYYGAGYYRIYRFHPYNLVGWTGTYTLIKNSTSSAIQAGLNKWNTLKIVKVGSNYTFYINNINLHSFTDSTYNPTYLSLVFHCGGMTTETRTDYVYLLPNS